MRNTTLFALAQCPYLSVDDLVLYARIGRPSAAKALGRLLRAGEAARLVLPDRHRHAYLYYLTPPGIVAAAAEARHDPTALTTHFGLTEAGLRDRLPLLPRLVASRRVLLALRHDLMDAGGAWRDWLAYPVRWRYTVRGQRRLYLLDGYGVVVPPGGLGWPVGYLWDGDPDAPPAFLTARLAELDAVRAAPEYGIGRRAAVPSVLLVAADAGRVPRAYRPGLLWTTVADIARDGPLRAPWRSTAARGGPAPLLEALGRATPPGEHRTPSDYVPSHRSGGGRGELVTRRRARPRRPPPTLAAQARAQVRPPFPARPGHPALVSYALHDASLAVLHAVGAHPYLTAAEVAEACGASARTARRWLRVCLAQELVAEWAETPADEERYGLTVRGTRVLAARAGVRPRLYAHVHALLDDGPVDPSTGRLIRLRGHSAHTAGINAIYLAFLRGVRRRGGRLIWRGEWACRHEYHSLPPVHLGRWNRGLEERPTRGVLYPDAEALYAGPSPEPRRLYYIEYDRNTEALTGDRGLEGKFTRYLEYRADLARRSGTPRPLTVLFVTTTPTRATAALTLAERLAIARREPPLDLHVTTDASLGPADPWVPIWSDLSGVPHGLDGVREGGPPASVRGCTVSKRTTDLSHETV